MSNRTNPYAVAGNPVQLIGRLWQRRGLAGAREEPGHIWSRRAHPRSTAAPAASSGTPARRGPGETEARIYQLDAWRESPLYSPRERAAIAWTEALTKMDRRDMDEAYEARRGGVHARRAGAAQPGHRRDQQLQPPQHRLCRRAAGRGRRPPGGGLMDAAERRRRRLRAAAAQAERVAYRMLGSVADAEDVVQDAFLRWLDADREAVDVPEAYLVRVVTRLCLDVLKSARRRRETYIGPWLPEPVVEAEDDERRRRHAAAAAGARTAVAARARRVPAARRVRHAVRRCRRLDRARCRREPPARHPRRQHVHEARPRFAVERAAGPGHRGGLLRRLAQRRTQRAQGDARRRCRR